MTHIVEIKQGKSIVILGELPFKCGPLTIRTATMLARKATKTAKVTKTAKAISYAKGSSRRCFTRKETSHSLGRTPFLAERIYNLLLNIRISFLHSGLSGLAESTAPMSMKAHYSWTRYSESCAFAGWFVQICPITFALDFLHWCHGEACQF